MNKKKIGIYPFNHECMIFSDFCDMLNDKYIFSEAASPASWGMAGMKINISESENEYILKSSPSQFKEKVDVLLVPEFESTKKSEKWVLEEILNYIPVVKELFYYGKMTHEGRKKIIEKCEECKCSFIDYRNNISNIDTVINDEGLVYTSVPVIAIAGMWENTDKFDIALSLTRKFITEGYKVLNIGSRGYCELFGADPFPEFMFDTSVSEFSKPVLFNKFINDIAERENPDIMIITIPGALQSFNNTYNNGFGILPYISFQSFLADYFILSTFYDNNSKEFLDNISNVSKYMFGVSPDVFHMSNMFIDMSETNEKKRVSQHFVDRRYVNESLEKEYGSTSGKVMNLFNENNIDILYSRIIATLGDDNSVIM